jgi:hypothetical protein
MDRWESRQVTGILHGQGVTRVWTGILVGSWCKNEQAAGLHGQADRQGVSKLVYGRDGGYCACVGSAGAVAAGWWAYEWTGCMLVGGRASRGCVSGQADGQTASGCTDTQVRAGGQHGKGAGDMALCVSLCCVQGCEHG